MAAPLVLGTLLELGSRIIDRVIPDKAKQDEAKLELMKMAENGWLQELNTLVASDANQVKLLEVDAKSDNKFQKYPRPAAIWVCVIALVYQFLAQPLLAWVSSNVGWMVPPVLELESLVTLLGGLLGLSAMRTVDKRSKFKYGGM